MTPDRLRSCGEALYGERWQSALATALGVTDRTVRRWVSGENEPPESVVAEIRDLALKALQTLPRETEKRLAVLRSFAQGD